MPRGGRRQGRAGANYPNRTDLSQSAALPITTVPGQAYGQAAQQQAAQQAVPMAPAPPPPAAAQPATQAAAAGGPPPVQPGQLGAFTRPTERPTEPVTSGLPSGAGPGPEALGFGGAAQPQTLSQVIAQAAQAAGSQELAALAQQARNKGQ